MASFSHIQSWTTWLQFSCFHPTANNSDVSSSLNYASLFVTRGKSLSDALVAKFFFLTSVELREIVSTYTLWVSCNDSARIDLRTATLGEKNESYLDYSLFKKSPTAHQTQWHLRKQVQDNGPSY